MKRTCSLCWQVVPIVPGWIGEVTSTAPIVVHVRDKGMPCNIGGAFWLIDREGLMRIDAYWDLDSSTEL